MITEQLMGLGDWSLTLRPDTPRSILNLLDVRAEGFGQLTVLPARFPREALTQAILLDLALYSGVYLGQAGKHTLRGCGPAMWLGDADGKGNNPTGPTSHTNGTLSQWMTSIKPSSITAGTYTNGSLPLLTWTMTRMSRRAAADYVCAALGAEWQVTHGLVLNAGTAANLYGSSPVALLAERASSFDIPELDCSIVPDSDVEDYTTHTFVIGGAGTGSAGPATNVYDDWLGNDVVQRRIIEDSSTEATEEATVAAAQLDLYDEIRTSLQVTCRSPLPTITAPVGSPVWIYDIEHGLYDAANSLQSNGETIFPKSARVVACQWPVLDGCGVYLANQSADIVDLSDWVIPEQGDSTITLDYTPRPLGPRLASSRLRAAA